MSSYVFLPGIFWRIALPHRQMPGLAWERSVDTAALHLQVAAGFRVPYGLLSRIVMLHCTSEAVFAKRAPLPHPPVDLHPSSIEERFGKRDGGLQRARLRQAIADLAATEFDWAYVTGDGRENTFAGPMFTHWDPDAMQATLAPSFAAAVSRDAVPLCRDIVQEMASSARRLDLLAYFSVILSRESLTKVWWKDLHARFGGNAAARTFRERVLATCALLSDKWPGFTATPFRHGIRLTGTPPRLAR